MTSLVRALAVLLLLVMGFAFTPPPAHAAEKVDGAPAEPGARANWIARAYVPDDETRLGEVRVLRVEGGLVVRTLLYSNLLKRIVAEIEIKAEEGWPEGSRYREDSRRYVDALARARSTVWARWRALGNRERGERTQTLVIDFIVTATRTAIEIGVPELVVDDGERQVSEIELLADDTDDTHEVYSDAFVRAEALRIIADQFPERVPALTQELPPAGE